MKKSTAAKKAGSAYKLAQMLGISRQAVSKWPDDSVPPDRIAQLRKMCPDWFTKGRKTA